MPGNYFMESQNVWVGILYFLWREMNNSPSGSLSENSGNLYPVNSVRSTIVSGYKRVLPTYLLPKVVHIYEKIRVTGYSGYTRMSMQDEA